MHELAVMRSILKICTERMEEEGKTKITKISLKVGALRNIEEPWMQQYFGYISPGTPAEGAKICIEKVPLVFRCDDCNTSYNPNPHNEKTFPCPNCGSQNYDMVSGRELIIDNMEVE